MTRVNGLGGLLGTAQANYDSGQVYGLLMIAGVLGFVVNWLVTKSDVLIARRFGS